MTVGARNQVVEFTYKDLKSAWNSESDYLKQRERVRELRRRGTRYAGLVGNSMIFRTFSSQYATNGRIWKQQIKLLDLAEKLKIPDTPLRDRARSALTEGDVALRCDCPAFVYWGWGYILSQLGAGAEGPTYDKNYPMLIGTAPGRYPNEPRKRRNVNQRGIMCKHLGLIMEVLGAHWTSLVRDLKKQGHE